MSIYTFFVVSVYLNVCGVNPKEHAVKNELVSSCVPV